jgi:uncharacterized alpha-E superfamily protein
MLARHAEDLFWAGRYLERAQDAARILDVAYHAAVSSPQGTVDLQLADVLSVLLVAESYREVHDDIDGRRVLSFCVHDRRNASSVVSLVFAVRENIRRARELLSSEVWEVVNDTYLRLRARNIARDIEQHPSELLGWVKIQSQAIVGVALETMPRDDALRFLLLGSQLERAAITLRLLRVEAAPLLDRESPSLSAWLQVLRACAGAETYLRAGGAARPGSDVIGFLLLDPEFPRSVRYAIDRSHEHIAALSPPEELNLPLRLVGLLHAELDFADATEIVEGDLPRTLGALHDQVFDIGEAVGSRFFPRPAELAFHTQSSFAAPSSVLGEAER